MFLLDLSPIAFSIGTISIYWYGIIYALSIFCSWKFACYVIQKSECGISKQEFEQFMFLCVISCIIGARLGHIFFFELEYYISHPIEIIMLRNGGMSFHGGIIGLIIAVFIFAKKHKTNIHVIFDVLSFAGAIGIFLGRIANFINQELYGVPSGSKWAVIFSRVDQLPRHPTQLYESLTEGLLSFCIMFIVWKIKGKQSIGSGLYTFLFLTIYSTSRYIIEFFKEVETITYFNMFSFTIGQILSIFLIAFAFINLQLKSRNN